MTTALSASRRLGLALALLSPAEIAGAQEPPPPVPSAAIISDPRTVAQVAQREFEDFRRQNLERYDGSVPAGGRCPEPVGMGMCYWYDPDGKLPGEKPEVTVARGRLLATLDSLGTLHPGDNWISGQRVRYLIEANRPADALKVAESCRSFGSWCDAIKGLSLHELGRYAEAEATFEKVLEAASARDRCHWRDLTPYLDDDTRRQYIRTECGTPARDAFEQRVWWYSRTRYGMEGNDSRTEHFSRLTYVEILRNSATPYGLEFDEAHRDLTIRFGWARWFARDESSISLFQGPRPPVQVSVVGAEPVPSHRFIPPAHVVTSPASSDSIDWAVQLPPVVARYHPKYASRLLMLEHQQALFRRGDTALVLLAYDVSKVPGLDSAKLDGALVLTPGTTPRWSGTTLKDVPKKGTMTVRAPWGPLLMSAEIAADSASTLVRARYGIRPPFAVGARVSLSDLLFFEPYGQLPTTVEEVLPHALPTQKVDATRKIGVYWEAYNTNPLGEQMTISLVVAPEDGEERGSRIGRALGLSRRSSSVSLTVQDMSAREVRMSPRALELDISTLRPGAYLVQLEVSVGGQYTIRADRRLVVVEP